MIVRVYRARPHAGMAKEYEEFLLRTADALMRSHPGCVDVTMGCTRWGEATAEFVVVSKWTSVDALKRFAGAEWQEPRILPEEAHLVREVWVEHYEEITPQ